MYEKIYPRLPSITIPQTKNVRGERERGDIDRSSRISAYIRDEPPGFFYLSRVDGAIVGIVRRCVSTRRTLPKSFLAGLAGGPKGRRNTRHTRSRRPRERRNSPGVFSGQRRALPLCSDFSALEMAEDARVPGEPRARGRHLAVSPRLVATDEKPDSSINGATLRFSGSSIARSWRAKE